MPFLLYLRNIYINIILFEFIYIKAYITLSYIIYKWNLVVNTSNRRKNIKAKIVALVGKSWYFYWFSQTINLALDFCKQQYLSVFSLNTYWQSTKYLITFYLIIINHFARLELYTMLQICYFIFWQNFFSSRYF